MGLLFFTSLIKFVCVLALRRVKASVLTKVKCLGTGVVNK